MSDRYIDFANSSFGHRLVAALGLPSPVRLERWQAGRLRPVEGALLLGGGALASKVQAFAHKLTDAIYTYGAENSTWIPGHGPKLKAVVFDASDLQHTDQLKQLREFFQPLLKNLDHSAHLVILGRAPESLDDPFAASAQRALDGFSRSLAKELRNGGVLQLLYVGDGAEDQLEGALRFFLSPKSAYISGQVIRLQACATQVEDWTRPLAGRKALVTGAARGIGASIAETLARDGADVILLDVPQAKADLEALAARLGASSVALDICAVDAAQQLIDHLQRKAFDRLYRTPRKPRHPQRQQHTQDPPTHRFSPSSTTAATSAGNDLQGFLRRLAAIESHWRDWPLPTVALPEIPTAPAGSIARPEPDSSF